MYTIYTFSFTELSKDRQLAAVQRLEKKNMPESWPDAPPKGCWQAASCGVSAITEQPRTMEGPWHVTMAVSVGGALTKAAGEPCAWHLHTCHAALVAQHNIKNRSSSEEDEKREKRVLLVWTITHPAYELGKWRELWAIWLLTFKSPVWWTVWWKRSCLLMYVDWWL